MELSREDMMAAITLGVRQAFEGALADIDLQATIKEGVLAGFCEVDADAVLVAMERAVFNAFDVVYASDVLEAIGEGTRKALHK